MSLADPVFGRYRHVREANVEVDVKGSGSEGVV
jgi:hypothetical protein